MGWRGGHRTRDHGLASDPRRRRTVPSIDGGISALRRFRAVLPPLFDSLGRNSGIDRVTRKHRVFRHETQRTDLAVRPDLHANFDDASKPDRDVIAETNTRGLDDALLNGVAGELNRTANHDIITTFQQVVIAH